MANANNLKPHQFSSANQPKQRRSRKGIPNRASVFKKLLNLKVNVLGPSGGKLNLTIYEAAAFAQIRAAMRGNTRAWIEIQDTLHGKQKAEINLDLTCEQLQKLTDEEFEFLYDQIIRSGRGPVKPMITIAEAKKAFEKRRQMRRKEIEELDELAAERD